MRRFPHILSAALANLLLLARTFLWTLPRLAARILFGRPWPLRSGPVWTLMLSFIEWDGSWQRPQHLASHLARRGPTVCCAPLRAHNVPLVRSLRLLFGCRQSLPDGPVVLRPLVLPAEFRWPLFRWLNALILLEVLQREACRQKARPTVLIANSPFFSLPFAWIPARVRLYDAMDELVRFDWAPPDAAAQEEQVVASADLVTTGTLALSRLKTSQYASLARRVEYVPCGVDAEHFAPPSPHTALPLDIASLPHPIIGYFGAINERIDPSMIDAVASAFPDGSIVLIGPVYRTFAGMASRPNIHFLGAKPYRDLPRYLAAFDCALVPYRLDRGIEFVQPVKVLEYLAGGKPVVSTRIPDVVELYGDRVRIGDTPAHFAEQVGKAIGQDRRAVSMPSEVRTWSDMADDFERLLRETAERKALAPRTVAHLIHGIHFGGAEELIGNLCASYAPERFTGRVICLGRGENLLKRLERLGVPVDIVEMQGKRNLQVIFPLIGSLRRNHVAILHTHSSRTNLLGRLVSRVAGVPVITTIHTAVARDINDLGRSNRLNAWIERRTRAWSARLVTVSERNRDEMIAEGVPSDRVLHIENGVCIPPLDSDGRWTGLSRQAEKVLRTDLGLPLQPGLLVGMLASMRPRKGPEVLLDAFPLLLKDVPGARLLMVGSGEFVERVDYLETLRQRSGDLGIADRVCFAGHRDDALAMLSLMDVVVLPSLFGEGMPLVLLEAMALGRPVVATRTEGNEEVVVHGETGLLVPPRDPQGLATALAALLQNPAWRLSLARAGRRRAEAFYCLERMTRRYETLYDEIPR